MKHYFVHFELNSFLENMFHKTRPYTKWWAKIEIYKKKANMEFHISRNNDFHVWDFWYSLLQMLTQKQMIESLGTPRYWRTGSFLSTFLALHNAVKYRGNKFDFQMDSNSSEKFFQFQLIPKSLKQMLLRQY